MAYSDVVMADAPVMYLPMQEAAGATTLADASGNAHSATLEGTVALADTTDPAAPASLGNHISLDGTSGDVLLAAGSWFDPSAGLALEGWFYVRSVTTWDVFFDLASAANTWDTYLAGVSGGSLEFVSSNGGVKVSTSTGYPVGQWFHLGVSMDATGSATIYLNGTALTTGAAGAATAGVRNAMRIGRDAYADPPLASSVTQVAIYNAPLSAARFSAHYSAATPLSAAVDTFNRSNGRRRTGISYATVTYDPVVPPPHIVPVPVRIMAQQIKGAL